MSRSVLLVDLSSIAHPIYAMTTNEPDPDVVSTRIVARVRALAEGVDHTAICCDSGRSFRKDISETYKANRPVERDAALYHQIDRACDILRGDGFPVWAVKGFEADDLIATAVHRALEDADAAEDTFVSIASADKDLLQLVGGHVTVKSLRDGSVIDEASVLAKFGVRPDQMLDYLCMVGDSSDNIAGVKGIGPKRAADILARFGELESVLVELDIDDDLASLGLTPAVAASLREFKPRLPEARALITLRTDVPLPFESLYTPRVPTQAEATFMQPETETTPADPTPPAPVEVETAAPPVARIVPPQPGADMAAPKSSQSQALVPAPAEWNKQLEPRSMSEAGQLAKWVHESRQFSAYGTPQAVLATVLAGRELGLQAMASLRSIHIVEGKPTLSADLIRALVLQSPACRYFRCTARSDEGATFVTQRGDDPPVELTFTLQQAKDAGLIKPRGGWERFPADMCVARASAKLARLVYPDVCFGLYLREELEEVA